MPKIKLIWIALAFSLLIALATATKAYHLGSPDFKVFYTAARYATSDPDVMYRRSPDRYLYPPATAIFLQPFAFSENYAAHQWIWHGLLALMLFCLTSPSWAALAAMLLLTRYLTITFFYGQINLVVMWLLLRAGANLGQKKSGFYWAFATCLKVYPAVLFPAYLRKDRLSAILVGAATALIILLLPFLYFGPERGVYLYQEFIHALESKGMPLHSHNQSFTALLLRLFSGERFHLHSVDDVNWTILLLPQWLIKVSAFLIGIVLAGFTWRTALKRGNSDSALSAAAFSMLFLSHIVWKDYLLFLYFPLREVFAQATRKQAWILGGVLLAIVTLSAPDVAGFQISSRLDAACVHLGAAILVWITWKNYLYRS